uniref:Uncharacterized protein n=1 Tax=Sphenodon punctatus TaxID=8508 RepID=A0A8D0GKZ1_SPHPU
PRKEKAVADAFLCPPCSSPTEKKSSSSPTLHLKSRYHLRKRNSPRGKPSPTGKRALPKGLVQISKHRLRRLPVSPMHVPAKEGSLHLLASPPGNKVIKTRYKIVKNDATSSSSASSFSIPTPSWKTRRLSISRSLVLNRTRQSPL